MSKVYYNGEHDIAIWNPEISSPKFLCNDYHLIPKSRPYISVSSVNIVTVSIPNASTFLNETPYLPGGKTYNERTGQWDFYIDHTKYSNWTEIINNLRNDIHGKRLYVSLVDHPTEIYEGRFSISNYSPDSNFSSISINYNLDYESIYDSVKQDLLYKIVFVDELGNVLQETYENYDSVPIYDNRPYEETTLVKGFNKQINKVNGNAVYTVYRTSISITNPIIFVGPSNTAYTYGYAPVNVLFRSGRD